MSLGEAAIYGGDPTAASRALSTLRARHPDSAETEAATFHLARMAATGGNTSRALGLLDEYTSRWPASPLTREARGLRLELLVRIGDPRAPGVARAYLKSYPKGPHARLARKVDKGAP